MNEVAAMIGYTLPANFSKDFHKQFGITPLIKLPEYDKIRLTATNTIQQTSANVL